MAKLEKFLTDPDATRLLGLSIHQLWYIRAKGDVPYGKLGARIVYTESALGKW